MASKARKRDRGPLFNHEKGGWIIDVVVWALLIFFCFLCLYPFWYVLIASFNDGYDMMKGGVYFWPRQFTLRNYVAFFSEPVWRTAITVSVSRTVIGTVLTTLITCLVSYAISRRTLVFGKTYRKLFVFSMYVSGGIIPFYMVLRLLGLINSFGVYVVPSILNLFFVMVGMSFFRSIPESLLEAAHLDGASEMRIFIQIVLPLSLPFIATLALMAAVGQWNSWIDSVYYVNSKSLRPMAYQMMSLINQTRATSGTTAAADFTSTLKVTTLTTQATAVVATVAPILLLYPSLQKYFVQGLMIGSVKE